MKHRKPKRSNVIFVLKLGNLCFYFCIYFLVLKAALRHDAKRRPAQHVRYTECHLLNCRLSVVRASVAAPWKHFSVKNESVATIFLCVA
jgi:hypothetical protein